MVEKQVREMTKQLVSLAEELDLECYAKTFDPRRAQAVALAIKAYAAEVAERLAKGVRHG
jgi:hypothetical protein